jgi:Putative adhesin
MKRALLTFGAVITVLMIGAGAYTLAAAAARETTTKKVNFAKVKIIRLDSGAGGVTIRGGSGPSVIGTRNEVRSFTKPSIRETLTDDGVLTLRNRCSNFISVNCEVNYTLTAPKGVRIEGTTSGGSIKLSELVGQVNVSSSAGGITAEKMAGSLRLKSSAGSVRVDTASGPLDLASSAGGVTVTNSTSETVKADSSAGSINLTFVSEPMTVDADSSAGGVHIVVPQGSSAYAVDASTSAGNATVKVKTDPSSKRTMKVRSSAGNVSVRYGAGLK